ncbi:MAG TPA: DCC1-like thiol-disulfide oxidoreductase family protein [Vicinamibacterales bacterium]
MTAHGANATACAYYDGDCRFCTALARRFEHVLARHDITLMPLQTVGAAALLGIADDRLLAEMRLRLRNGHVYGGADAVMQIARRVWWAWPLWAVTRIPGAMRPARAVYRWIANHRSCSDGVCELPTESRSTWSSALPVVVLPLVALVTAPLVPRWVFMWTMAFALFAGCKWLTYCESSIRVARVGWLRALGYLFAWPGMDANAFMNSGDHVARPDAAEWIAAMFKTVFGAFLLWRGAREALPLGPDAAAWVGMIGAILLLHFGTFHLLSVCWRRAGVDAVPLMRIPMRSTSLGELWGRRWNTAFHELALRFTFKPLRHRIGLGPATLATFLASGLIHELVISVPAGGGYGLPTGYFVLQGLGIAGERSSLGRRLGLGGGVRGWLYTVLVAAGPVAMLFPPVFVQRIILPMLAAIGAM